MLPPQGVVPAYLKVIAVQYTRCNACRHNLLLSEQHSILSTFTPSAPVVQTLATFATNTAASCVNQPETILRQAPFHQASRSYGTVQAASGCTSKRILIAQLHRLR